MGDLERPDRTPLTQRPAWARLREHHAAIRDVHLRELFAADPRRGERLTAEAAGIYLDYSKNRVTDETLQLLLELAEQSGLRERIDAMFSGQKINGTEGRAVLHVALRAPKNVSIDVDGVDVVPAVHEVLGVARGHALVLFGGERGAALQLSAGDVAILPAGTGHKCLFASHNLRVIGAYPPGSEMHVTLPTYDNHRKALQQIPAVPRPETDPVFGRAGGLTALWTSGAAS